MLTRLLRLSAGVALVAVAATVAVTACDLNPQPLPPGATDGVTSDAGATSGPPVANSDAGSAAPILGSDAGTIPLADGGVSTVVDAAPLDAAPDGSEEGGADAALIDAGAGGDAGDASADAPEDSQ